MKPIAILPALACAALATAAAAQPRPPACPTLELSGPYETSGKTPFTLTALVKDAGDVDPTYNWVVSAGALESGQGTSTVTVNAEGAAFLTATVEIGGFDRACSAVASHSVSVTD